jgi:hypothetical protein
MWALALEIKRCRFVYPFEVYWSLELLCPWRRRANIEVSNGRWQSRFSSFSTLNHSLCQRWQASSRVTCRRQSDCGRLLLTCITTQSIGPSRVVHQLRGAANKYSVFIKTSVPGLYTTSVTVRNRFVAKHSFYIFARLYESFLPLTPRNGPQEVFCEGQPTSKAGNLSMCDPTCGCGGQSPYDELR